MLEHRASRTSRWLRTNRFRLAFLIALAETVLVLTSGVQWRWVLLFAGVVFAFHFFVGRHARWDTLRQLSWAAAVSQTMPVIVPVLVATAVTLVVLGTVAAAIVVAALFFLGRR